jgi:phage tail sheath protein FI
VALLNQAQAANKFALLDGADTPSDTTLSAEADAIRASVDLTSLSETFGMLLAPWHVISGLTTGTTRTVPPSAIAAGLIARSDGRYNNPNLPAAGANGESSITLSLSQPSWADAAREALNDAGVDVFRDVYGGFRLYGYRTLADTNNLDSAAWINAGAARLRMAIIADLEAISEQFLFSQLDGKGLKIAEFNGALTGKLQGYWSRGSIYGDSASEAFAVDTGPTVNTPATLANNELHAVVGLRVSPFAELAYVEVVKVPITEAL